MKLEDVTQKAFNAFLGNLEAPTFAYRSYFPDLFTNSLTWESLEGDGNLTIAADVIAHDSSAELKTRPDAVRQTGEILKIAVLNRITEKQLHNLYTLENNPKGQENQIYRIIFGDIARSYYGVHARLELLAMQALSTGAADTTTNNNGISATATFKVPNLNKTGASVVWNADATTTKPIDDLKERVKYAKGKGYTVTKILMDEQTFDYMRVSTQVKEQYSGLLGLSVGTLSPSLEQINVVLRSNLLPPIEIVDTSVVVEGPDGTRSTLYPWSSGKVTFLSSPTAGNTMYTLTAEQKVPGYQDPGSLASNRDIVRMTRYNELNPFRVYTKGEAVAFPVLNNVKGIFYLNTLNATTWS